MTLEEKIEEERLKLGSEGLTPVTLESFKEWKKRKAERKQKELEEKVKEEAKKAGSKGTNIMSGRALFKYDPTLFKDDEEAAGEDVYEERIEEEEEKKEEDEERKDGQEESKEDGTNGDST